MTESATKQAKTSWLSVIFGFCGVLLLAVYILWSPGNQEASSSVQPESSEIQEQSTGQIIK